MEKLNTDLLKSVKSAFVAMPGGADPSLGAGPVAGGGLMTQAQAAPMGGTPPMDPAMMGGAPPMDPAMMGGAPPMDPAMMGGDPAMMGGAPPMDPAMAGGAPPEGDMAAPAGMIQLSPQEFTDILTALLTAAVDGKAVAGGAVGGGGAPKAAGNGGGTAEKLDQIISMLGGGGAAPAEPGM
jgi:hypothetical protein